MAISLVKGQKVDLTKGNSGLSKVIVGLGWDVAGLFNKKIDCDASVIMLQDGKLKENRDIVYFGHQTHGSGSVKHMGDNVTGEGDGDDEQILIHLNDVPEKYDKIVVVVNIFKSAENHQHFGKIKNAFCRLVDESTGAELLRYDLSENYAGKTAMIFGELYRRDGGWKFSAAGVGTEDGSIKDLAKRYL